MRQFRAWLTSVPLSAGILAQTHANNQSLRGFFQQRAVNSTTQHTVPSTAMTMLAVLPA